MIPAGSVGTFLERGQPVDSVDRREDALRQRGMIGEEHDAVVVAERHAGEGAVQCKDRYAVEDILQYLELEAAAVAFGYDGDAGIVHVARDVRYGAGEARCHR